METDKISIIDEILLNQLKRLEEKAETADIEQLCAISIAMRELTKACYLPY